MHLHIFDRLFTVSHSEMRFIMSDKREDYISWDEYFMGVAYLASMRSKDPNTQVGACIVSPENKILSMGYNGFPSGCVSIMWFIANTLMLSPIMTILSR